MIDMSKFGSKGSMIERAASRVRVAHLERQRASKAYKLYMKDANTADLTGDEVFEKLRLDMQTTKANHVSALQAEEAVTVAPPLT